MAHETGEWGTIRLDGALFPVEPGSWVQRSHLAIFERKVTMGEATIDDDDFVSTQAWRDWSGGLGIEDMNEGSDQQRFWFGVAETRSSRHVTLPPEVVQTRPGAVASTAVARPLGPVGLSFYVAFDAIPYGFRENDDTWYAASPTLTNAPVGKGVAYKGYLWVPQGANGYRRLSEAGAGTLTVDASPAGITPVAFCRWSNMLFALEHDGGLVYNVTGGNTAGDWIAPTDPETGAALTLESGQTPRGLQSYFNRNGDPTLHVVTNREVLLYNHTAKRLTSSHLQFPPHADNGLGSAVWRAGEDIWVSQGIGVSRMTSASVIVPGAGPDRDDGLPGAYLGRIVDLTPEYNGLWALIQGDPSLAAPSQSWAEDLAGDEELYLPGGSAYALLLCWTGTGWHALWASADPAGVPTWAVVSDLAEDGAYRLWWGVGPDAFTMRLRKTFHNPKQGWRRGVDRFGGTGYVETPRFDAAMMGFGKIATHLTAYADHASATETITVRYRTDADPEGDDYPWTLGTITAPGKTRFLFDPDADGFAEGHAFGWVQFRLDLARGTDATETPIGDGIALHFVKVPQDAESYVFSVPLPIADWNERSAEEIVAHLEAILRGDQLVEFEHGGTSRRVRMASLVGADGTGLDRSGARTVTLIEITGGTVAVA